MKVGGERYATAAPGAPLENRRIRLFPEEEADLVGRDLQTGGLPGAGLARTGRSHLIASLRSGDYTWRHGAVAAAPVPDSQLVVEDEGG